MREEQLCKFNLNNLKSINYYYTYITNGAGTKQKEMQEGVFKAPSATKAF